MNDTKQIWEQSKEEFGERAFERFLIKFKSQLLPIQDNKTAEMSLDIISLKPMPELFAHDVEVYGENAFLMWEWIFDNEKDNDWKPFKNNQDVIDVLNSVNYTVRRKISAALPFDLERAKADDVVEINIGGMGVEEWVDGEFQGKIDYYHDDNRFQVSGQDCDLYHLRMKYPPKVVR